ncbi:MAG TPA: beta-ketoacyl-ACP synthase III [Waddliaceae bacterium]
MAEKVRARIIGIGSYLPDKVLSNTDLEKMVDTTDEWIFSRTGMRERRIAAAHEASSDMAIAASKKALEQASVPPEEIDMILVATATPDYLMASTAAIVQARLGANRAAAVDIQAACTGYLYGLSIAKAYVESKMYRTVLLVASDKMSSFIDYQDRSTCVLFGDGASAAIIRDKGKGLSIESICLGADGELSDLIIIPGGGSRHPPSNETLLERKHYFKMAGKEVFKHAVRRMSQAARECLEQVGLQENQISWLVPHQANERIIDALAKQFQIPLERVGKTIHKYGNTSASSLAITLDEMQNEQLIKYGEYVLVVAFGGGLTWGAAMLAKTEM